MRTHAEGPRGTPASKRARRRQSDSFVAVAVIGAAMVILAGCGKRASLSNADAGNADSSVATPDAADAPVSIDGIVPDGPLVADTAVDAPVGADAATDGPFMPDAAADGTAVADTAADGTGDPVVGRHAFIVTSAYRVAQDGGAPPISDGTHAFTLVLDADMGVAIVGTTTVPLVRVDGRSFRTGGQFSVALASSACGSSIRYETLTVTVDNAGVTGSGTGMVSVIVTDIGYSARVAMTVTGVPDTVPPSVTFAGGTDVNPLLGLSAGLSETVPAGATAELRTGTADPIPLAPLVTTDGRILYGFQKPNLVLRYATSYGLVTNGVADFAGNPVSAAGPFTFTTRAAPPLVAEDGFESAPDGALGGAQVVSGAGWPVLAGARSLYLQQRGGTSPALGFTPLSVRVALAPGDQVVRFSYRLVSPSATTILWTPTLVIGAVGAGTAALRIASETGSFAAFQLPDQSTIYLGAVKTAEIPIPAGSTGDIVIERAESVVSCGNPGPPLAGLIIDDLRAE
jgi:hypothetical protein